MKKRLECTAKRKTRRDNFHAPIWQTLVAGFAALLLSRLFVPASLFCPRLPTPSSSCSPVHASLSYFFEPILSSYPLMSTLLSLLVSALLSPLESASSFLLMPVLLSYLTSATLFCFVLDLALTYLIFTALKTFKQALSNKLLGRQSTSSSPTEPFYLFLTLSLLPKKAFSSSFLIRHW